jgi:multidrug resistance efflux pump
VCATAFTVHARLDIDSFRHALTDSRGRVVHLDAQIRDARSQRAQAAADLAVARTTLATDTGTRDRLRETDRVEYARLTAALSDLARHRAEVATNTARAQRLDACLLVTSQVLNEAAVGDTAHLATTLPGAAQLCSEAAA